MVIKMNKPMTESTRYDSMDNLIPLCPFCRYDTLQERNGKYGQFFYCRDCNKTTNRGQIQRINGDGPYDDTEDYGWVINR